MARRPTAVVIPEEDFADPINRVMREDRGNVADALADALDNLGAVDQSTIKGILYRIPVPNGKYEWIRDVFPPFDLSEIMRSLKEEIGGGDYAVRLMAEGKVKKTVHFSILRDKVDGAGMVKRGDETLSLMQLMMAQQAEASREARASSDRQMQMMMQMGQQSTQMLVGIMSAMMGAQAKPADMLPLIAAMREGRDGNPMKDAIETLTAAKGLFGGEPGSGFDADDLVGSALKLAGPVVGALGRAAQGRSEAQAPQPEPQALDYTRNPAAPQPLRLPGTGEGAASHPIIDLIAPDVLFMAGRGYDPEVAADAILSRLEDAGVTEGAVNELVAQIGLGPDPWGALAGYGLDLRGDVGWAEQFLSALVRLHAEAGRDDDDPAGGGGDEGDAADDGEAGEGRLASA